MLEYSHMGETAMRLRRVMLRKAIGEKSASDMGIGCAVAAHDSAGRNTCPRERRRRLAKRSARSHRIARFGRWDARVGLHRVRRPFGQHFLQLLVVAVEV